MNMQGSCTLEAFFVISMICSLAPGTVFGLPLSTETTDEAVSQVDTVPRDDDRRATWLETRNLENNFKQLVYLSMQELVREGRIDSRVLGDKAAPEKRGRHQGFCFKKTKSGRFLPYICWKGEGDNDEK